MSELDDFVNLLTMKPEVPLTTKVHFQWDYVAQFIVWIRDPEEYPEESERVEILDSQHIPVRGTLDSECYYSECISNAQPSDILETDYTGKYQIDFEQMPPGFYRMVFGVVCKSDKQWTDCGYEYDAWEEYEKISQYKYDEKEEKFMISTLIENDPEDERLFQFEVNEDGNS